MRVAPGLVLPILLLAAGGCRKEPELSPAEKAAKDRSECMVAATQQTGFDPLTAEAPPRTVSSTQKRGGEVVGSGAIAEGAAKGALVGVVGGAIGGNVGAGAAAGAAAGGLIGGVRRHRETQEMVTTTRANPEYEQYVQAKDAYKQALEQCLAARAMEGAKP